MELFEILERCDFFVLDLYLFFLIITLVLDVMGPDLEV
jgi:hypothetical protein